MVPMRNGFGVPATGCEPVCSRPAMTRTSMPDAAEVDFLKAVNDVKRWRDIWAAGQGVGSIARQQSIGDIVDQLEREYLSA